MIEKGFRKFLNPHASNIRVGDFDEAVFLASRGVSAIMRLRIDKRLEKLESPAFREELIEMLARYLPAAK